MYKVCALTPNAPDSADDRPHVHRIYLLDKGVLELVDEHLNAEVRDRRLDRFMRPVPGVLAACCSLTGRECTTSTRHGEQGSIEF